jgi:hypothetical protein
MTCPGAYYAPPVPGISLGLTPMLQKEFSLSTEQIGKATSHFTIGFGLLRVEKGVEHITSAGSGTLVTVGSVDGILTAAHVIEALRRSEPPRRSEHHAAGRPVAKCADWCWTRASTRSNAAPRS